MKIKYLLLSILMIGFIVSCNEDSVSVDVPITPTDTTKVEIDYSRYDSLYFCRNEPMTIYGTGFGQDTGNLAVYFNDMQLPILYVSDSTLTIITPDTEKAGELSIVKNQIKTTFPEKIQIVSYYCFELYSKSFEINDNSAIVELGANDFLKYLEVLSIKVGNQVLDFNVVSDKILSLSLPSLEAGTYSIDLMLYNHKWISIPLNIIKNNDFKINGFAPAKVKNGETVVISGSGFGTDISHLTVECELISSADTWLKFKPVVISDCTDTTISFVVPDWSKYETFIKVTKGEKSKVADTKLIIDKGSLDYSMLNIQLSDFRFEVTKKGIDNLEPVDSIYIDKYELDAEDLNIMNCFNGSKFHFYKSTSTSGQYPEIDEYSLAIDFEIDTIQKLLKNFKFTKRGKSIYRTNHQQYTYTNEKEVEFEITEMPYAIVNGNLQILLESTDLSNLQCKMNYDLYYKYDVYSVGAVTEYNIESTGKIVYNNETKLQISMER